MKTSFFTRFRLDAELRRLAGENARRGRPLKLTLDIVFKALFCGDSEESRNALRSLISDCIHRPVRDLSVRNSEIGPEDLWGKTVRLDIHASFNDGEEADIEMQAGKSDDDLKARAAVYAARLLSGQARRGKKYREVKRVYQIFFLDNILFPGSAKLPRRYSLREESEHDQLSEVAEILFYELPKLEGDVRNCLAGKRELADLSSEWKWCIYLKYREEAGMAGLVEDLIRQEEGIMNAERALKKMNREREQWARALWREKRAMDYLDYKTRLDEALAAGLAEGRKESQWEAARRFKRMGLPVEQIARGLDLSPGEIEKL
ncbi:MAG: Rpn family recombination-promoting nuclease/putative transposase [Treponema sp.]|jgi:predicted transposase/invertase (TIGR01784 family)|nr:Rpn family recombination-promoting nuclease/putative transposase [Treponema sp.]